MSDELSGADHEDEGLDGGVPGDDVSEDEVSGDEESEDEDPEEIPFLVMAAMRDRMHARRLSPADDPSHVEVSLGTAEDDLHVVDDGPDHCMIGRSVGFTPDGCVYVLVGRLSRYGYEQLRDEEVALTDAFGEARDITLGAVYEADGIVQNIAQIRRFHHPDDIPSEFLPPSPFLEFSDDEFPDDGEDLAIAEDVVTDEVFPADDDAPGDETPAFEAPYD
jgi:hypothetical protein